MKFENMCKQIINEGKSKKTNKKDVVDGEKNKIDVITEIDQEPAEENMQVPDKSAEVGLDDIEQQFIEKFIEFTELNCVLKCHKEIVAGFKSALGKNNKLVNEILAARKTEQTERLNTLKTELKTMREEIQAEEKNKAEAAERKLSIVNLLDSASKKTKEQTEEK
jgi:hypothetical protein